MQAADQDKSARYAELVETRREYDPTPLGLKNPSSIESSLYDAPHVGPWTRWAHDLNADLMIVGQDWGDEDYFITNRGLNKPNNTTNIALKELLASVGRIIPEPLAPGDADDPHMASKRESCRVCLTDALLWLKTGGLSAKVEQEWFGAPAIPFLKEQIAIVEPRVVVALGQQAHNCLLRAYGIPRHRGPFASVVEDPVGIELPTSPRPVVLLGVYHCGRRIHNTLRPLSKQIRDWERVARALNRNTDQGAPTDDIESSLA